MKCAVLCEPGNLSIISRPAPNPGPDEVLIRVKYGAICGTDVSLYNGRCAGRLPLVPGHEAVGYVIEVGEVVHDLKVGQLVTIQPNYGCMRCSLCTRGLDNICSDKVRIGLDQDGIFSEYVVLPRRAIRMVPPGLSPEVAVFAEPLAVAIRGFSKTRVVPGNRALVIGTGVIGLLTLQLLSRNGTEVDGVDPVHHRLQIAKTLGAVDVADKLSALDHFETGYDVVIEASGSAGALMDAVNAAAPGGKIVMLGLSSSSTPVLAAQIVRKALRVMGSMIYTSEFEDALELLASGEIKTKCLVSSIIPLEQLSMALRDFDQPTRVKTLVRIGR